MNSTLSRSAPAIAPAYTAVTWHSHIDLASSADLDTLAADVAEGWLLLWLHHGVFALRVQGGSLAAHPALASLRALDLQDHLVRARAFDADHEWHVWRSATGLQGRRRTEHPAVGDLPPSGAGAPDRALQACEAVDTYMPLLGVIADQLPPAFGGTWVLHTRHYIGHDDFNLAGYVDCRLVSIEVKGGVR